MRHATTPNKRTIFIFHSPFNLFQVQAMRAPRPLASLVLRSIDQCHTYNHCALVSRDAARALPLEVSASEVRGRGGQTIRIDLCTRVQTPTVQVQYSGRTFRTNRRSWRRHRAAFAQLAFSAFHTETTLPGCLLRSKRLRSPAPGRLPGK